MKKYIDKVILYSWPLFFVIYLFCFLGLVFFIEAISGWLYLAAAGYDFGDHPTDDSGIDMISTFKWILLFITPIVFAIISVAFISIFSYIINPEKGYWNCFKSIYTGCVRWSWVVISLLTVIYIIVLPFIE